MKNVKSHDFSIMIDISQLKVMHDFDFGQQSIMIDQS
jgi:hypothetical protein